MASTEARKRESFTRGMDSPPRWDRPSVFVVSHASLDRLTDDKRRSSVPPTSELRSDAQGGALCHYSSRFTKEACEELAGAAADFAQGDIEGLLVEVSRSPAVD